MTQMDLDAAGVAPRRTRMDLRTASAALGLMALGLLMLNHIWHRFPTDFSALYMAGYFYQLGEFGLIYDAPEGFFGGAPPLWAPHLAQIGLAEQPVVPYVYPPLWAALMAPFADGTGMGAVVRGAMILKVAAILGSVVVAYRLCRPHAGAFWLWGGISAALLASSVITLTALYYLQPQIVVVFLVLLAFERYGRGAAMSAGALLGLAAMMKVAPAGLLLIFLLDRNWRALGGFFAAVAALGALGLVVAGPQLHLAFLAAMANASEGTLVTSINFNVGVLLYGLTQELDWTARNVTIQLPLALELLAKAIGGAALIWAVLRTHGMPPQTRLVLRLFLFGLLLNLFGPLSWAHYFLLQLFLLPAMIWILPRPVGLLCVLGTGVLTSWWALMLLRVVAPGDFPVASVFTLVFVGLFVVVARKSPA